MKTETFIQKSEQLKFNIPKDSGDKRRLLIDLENQVGVILKEEDGFFIVLRYKPSRKPRT